MKESTHDKAIRFKALRDAKMSYADIGRNENPPITRERVRQVLQTIGANGRIERPLKTYQFTCQRCGKKDESYTSGRKYCSKLCFGALTSKFGRMRSEWTKEEWKEAYRYWNAIPSRIEARKEYYKRMMSDPKRRKRHYEKNKKYQEAHKEEIAKKRKIYYEKLKNDPEYLKNRRQWQKEYYKRPEVKEKRKAYYKARYHRQRLDKQ